MSQTQIAKTVIDNPIDPDYNDPGYPRDVIEAILRMDGGPLAMNQATYTESTIQMFLEDQNPILLMYEDGNNTGHVVISCGYLSVNGRNCYVIYDPWPVNAGAIYVRTFDNLYTRVSSTGQLTSCYTIITRHTSYAGSDSINTY